MRSVAILFKTHQPHFDMLAKTWLISGVRAFGIQLKGMEMQVWPSHAVIPAEAHTYPLVVAEQEVGALCVVGGDPAVVRPRLKADAILVTRLLRLEMDLDTLTTELVDTQDRFLALHYLTQATRNYLSTEHTLNRFTYEATRLSKVEHAFLILCIEDTPVCISHYPTPLIPDEMLHVYLDEIKRTENKLLWGADNIPEGATGFASLLMVPIRIHGAIVAALGLLNKIDGDFASPDIKLAQAIAEHAGAKIESVLLYQENLEKVKLQAEMQLAEQVQLHLLPQRLPSVTGLDLWANSKPASQVGGDFYDFSLQETVPFTFSVGDISGKGMGAALLMAMTRTVLRTKLNVVSVPSPEGLLERANTDLYNDFTEVNMFATVFVGQYHPETRVLAYANAGHSPVVYCPAGGKAHLLEADGTPMGILPISLSKNHTLNFAPGDVLVVATDGFNEARNAYDEMLGYKKFLDLIESLADKSAQEIAQALYAAVEAYSSGTAQDDDQTLVVVKGVA